MKVKVLSRNAEEHERDTKHELHRQQKNVDPKLHPLEGAREYKRAINAVKLERVFAKPFLGALDGHTDGVYCMAAHPTRLPILLSGACDGEVRIWNLTSRRCLYNSTLHKGFVRGLCVTPSGEQFISVGQDKTIKIAKLSMLGHAALSAAAAAAEADDEDVQVEAPIGIVGKSYFTDVDHHRKEDYFATAGQQVEIWSMLRSEPLQGISWGADTVNCVRFNPVEVNVFASTADDRSVTLYDIRASSPMRKLTLAMRSNRLCWNPMEALNFTVANEDHNCYTFDMRKLDHALTVHKDHASAVMDICYAPTGKEFVTASYDCTLRIFGSDQGHSREIYHTKRMQRAFCAHWTADNRYIVSGSDETNLRLWKARAWEQLGPLSARQRTAINYNEKLKERFAHHPEVKRIARHRHEPKAVHAAKREKREMLQAKKRREDNRRAHSKPGAVPHVPERRKQIIKEDE